MPYYFTVLSGRRAPLLKILVITLLVAFSSTSRAGTVKLDPTGVTIDTLPSSGSYADPVCYNSSGKLGGCNSTIYGNKAYMAWVALGGTGDYSSPVDAMTNTNEWCPATGPAYHCLLLIAPGTYDIGTASLQMQSFIDIQGSGRDTTIISGKRTSYGAGSGMIEGASNSSLRSLSVKTATDASPLLDSYISAIYNDGTNFVVDDVGILAVGQQQTNLFIYGVNNRGGSITIKNSSFDVQTGDYVRALYVRNSDATVLSSSFSALSGLTNSRSIMTNNNSASSTPYVEIEQSRIDNGDIYVGTDTILRLRLSYFSTSNIIENNGTMSCTGISSLNLFYADTCP